MKKWIVENVFKSVTIWIWAVLFLSSTILAITRVLGGDAWVAAQIAFAGIVGAKRAVENVAALKTGK